MAHKHSTLLFKFTYIALAIITGLAVATPPAFAANILPDSKMGAIAMIVAIALLMLVLVVEIWRQTIKDMQTHTQRPAVTRKKTR